jgi:hypothetical protein
MDSATTKRRCSPSCRRAGDERWCLLEGARGGGTTRGAGDCRRRAAAASPPLKISSPHMKPAEVLLDLPARAVWETATRMDGERKRRSMDPRLVGAEEAGVRRSQQRRHSVLPFVPSVLLSLTRTHKLIIHSAESVPNNENKKHFSLNNLETFLILKL